MQRVEKKIELLLQSHWSGFEVQTKSETLFRVLRKSRKLIFWALVAMHFSRGEQSSNITRKISSDGRSIVVSLSNES